MSASFASHIFPQKKQHYVPQHRFFMEKRSSKHISPASISKSSPSKAQYKAPEIEEEEEKYKTGTKKQLQHYTQTSERIPYRYSSVSQSLAHDSQIKRVAAMPSSQRQYDYSNFDIDDNISKDHLDKNVASFLPSILARTTNTNLKKESVGYSPFSRQQLLEQINMFYGMMKSRGSKGKGKDKNKNKSLRNQPQTSVVQSNLYTQNVSENDNNSGNSPRHENSKQKIVRLFRKLESLKVQEQHIREETLNFIQIQSINDKNMLQMHTKGTGCASDREEFIDQCVRGVAAQRVYAVSGRNHSTSLQEQSQRDVSGDNLQKQLRKPMRCINPALKFRVAQTVHRLKTQAQQEELQSMSGVQCRDEDSFCVAQYDSSDWQQQPEMIPAQEGKKAGRRRHNARSGFTSKVLQQNSQTSHQSSSRNIFAIAGAAPGQYYQQQQGQFLEMDGNTGEDLDLQEYVTTNRNRHQEWG